VALVVRMKGRKSRSMNTANVGGCEFLDPYFSFRKRRSSRSFHLFGNPLVVLIRSRFSDLFRARSADANGTDLTAFAVVILAMLTLWAVRVGALPRSRTVDALRPTRAGRFSILAPMREDDYESLAVELDANEQESEIRQVHERSGWTFLEKLQPENRRTTLVFRRKRTRSDEFRPPVNSPSLVRRGSA